MHTLEAIETGKLVPFEISRDRRIGALFKMATRMQWEVVAYDSIGVWLRRRRRYSAYYYFAGALTVPLLGLGLLVWVAGWIDYAMSRDERLFIPTGDLMSREAAGFADLLR